jgi:hypothetical protein
MVSGIFIIRRWTSSGNPFFDIALSPSHISSDLNRPWKAISSQHARQGPLRELQTIAQVSFCKQSRFQSFVFVRLLNHL